MKRKNFKPTNDIIFKLLFGEVGRENILKDFLEAILDIKINRVILNRQREIMAKEIGGKMAILDIIAELPDKTLINIEMQNKNYRNIEKRFRYYMNGIYNRNIKEGTDYTYLTRVIVIGILNFDYFKNIEEYHTVWRTVEQNHTGEIFDNEEFHFIELPKFMRSKIDINDKLSQWLVFLNHERKELVEMTKEKNVVVREASAAYDTVTSTNWDAIYEFLEEERERNRLIEVRAKMEKKIERAKKKGIQQGMQQGMQQIIKTMKESGMLNEEIARVTKLTLEEVEKI